MIYISFITGPVWSFLVNERERYFLDWTGMILTGFEIDWERYFKKIPFCSFELDGIGQKTNLTYAWIKVNKHDDKFY